MILENGLQFAAASPPITRLLGLPTSFFQGGRLTDAELQIALVDRLSNTIETLLGMSMLITSNLQDANGCGG